jgi:hypothetical protein
VTQITGVAPDLHRISTYVPEINLQFGQFLVRDDEPLLFHTGLKSFFLLHATRSRACSNRRGFAFEVSVRMSLSMSHWRVPIGPRKTTSASLASRT